MWTFVQLWLFFSNENIGIAVMKRNPKPMGSHTHRVPQFFAYCEALDEQVKPGK
jgi:hypothetical protein